MGRPAQPKYDPVPRLELNWGYKLGPVMRRKAENAATDALGPDALILSPRVLLSKADSAPSPVARFAILVAGTTYAELENLRRQRFALFTSDASRPDILHMGVTVEPGDKIGRWQNRPALAVRVSPGMSVHFLGLIGRAHFERLETHGLTVAGTAATGGVVDAIEELQISHQFGDKIPIVEPPHTKT